MFLCCSPIRTRGIPFTLTPSIYMMLNIYYYVTRRSKKKAHEH